MISTLLDVIGAACLIVFAYLLFPPAALAVGGLAALLASRQMTAAARGERR